MQSSIGPDDIMEFNVRLEILQKNYLSLVPTKYNYWRLTQ
jgi:hypothetical protein